ncbi:BQ2448_3746 [Microbotryum intermedium]|uniref:BQ2448_3746 protein n=1 Tax=Microbotryum intermedium TaxID=269621 RepID=A0A238FGH5_9BASI|nr:BQ2448_3746 [Microbotryum intermedium]
MSNTSNGDEDELAILELQAEPLGLKGPLVPLLPPKRNARKHARELLPRRSRGTPFGPYGRSIDSSSLLHSRGRSDQALLSQLPRRLRCQASRCREPPRRRRVGPACSARFCRELLNVQLKGLRSPTNLYDANELASQQQLYTVVNRYHSSKTHGPGDRRSATLKDSSKEPVLRMVMGHANSFHKDQLSNRCFPICSTNLLDSKTRSIGEIWSIDTFNQGHSALLNEEVLGKTFNWAGTLPISSFRTCPTPFSRSDDRRATITAIPDGMRDLDARPLHPGLSAATNRIFRNRLIVGIGHSLSGAGVPCLRRECSTFPLFVVDLPRSRAFIGKDCWPSKVATMTSLMKKPFYQTFDPRCMSYVEYGMISIPGSSEARLKARSQDEARPTISPVRFICADVGCSVLTDDGLKDILRLIPQAAVVRVKHAFHTLVQEKPKETAAEVAKHLVLLYGDSKKARL